MVALAEQLHHEETTTPPRLQGTGYGLQRAQESAQSRKSVDRFLSPAARPLLSSVPSVVRNRVSFIAHCSLAIERSADSGIRIEVTTVTGTNAPLTTYYLVDGNNPTGYAQVIEQSATPGTPTITYIWGETLIQQDNAAGTANAGVYYLIADSHGSTRLLVNSTGSVVQDYYYDGFGNAIGFTPSAAITEYLYSQQYYDVISGQYYMRARNYDPATGTFTQQDTISIAPGDIANANLFLFAGADPINMGDPSGHDLMETLGCLAIQSMIGSIISPVIAPFASDALGLLIPSWVTQGMLDAVPDAALIGGNLSALWRAGASPFSLGITGGLDLLLSAKDHYAALYDYAGGSLGVFGAGPRSIGGSLAVGAVWRAPRSGDYSGAFISATIPFTSELFPASLRNRLRDILTTTFVSEKLLSVIGSPLPGEAAPGGWDLSNYVQYNLHQINSAIQQAESWISRASITLFFDPTPPYSFGFSVGIGASAASLTGTSSPTGLSLTFYHQLWDTGSGASNGW